MHASFDCIQQQQQYDHRSRSLNFLIEISTGWLVCMQESSRLKEIPVVIMSSENVPTRISRLASHAQALNLFKYFQCSSCFLLLIVDVASVWLVMSGAWRKAPRISC